MPEVIQFHTLSKSDYKAAREFQIMLLPETCVEVFVAACTK